MLTSLGVQCEIRDLGWKAIGRAGLFVNWRRTVFELVSRKGGFSFGFSKSCSTWKLDPFWESGAATARLECSSVWLVIRSASAESLTCESGAFKIFALELLTISFVFQGHNSARVSFTAIL